MKEKIPGRSHVADTPALARYYADLATASFHTGSTVYQVAKGSGFSVIDGNRFDWTERDIFAVPSWAVHEHANASDRDDACLFSFHDLPVLRALGLYREAAWEAGDGRQEIIA